MVNNEYYTYLEKYIDGNNINITLNSHNYFKTIQLRLIYFQHQLCYVAMLMIIIFDILI